MNPETEKERKTMDFRLIIMLFQVAVFGLILMTAFVIKSVGGDFYNTVRKEYIKYFEKETDIEDVLSPKEDFSSFEEGYTVIVE